MNSRILIIGFSVRAAIASARRAGFQPLGVDYFADCDSTAIAPVRQVHGYPADLIRAAVDMPAAPFMYTGALENHSNIVEQLQHHRVLLGNDAATIRRVRNPTRLAKILQTAGHPMPPMDDDRRHVPTDGSWLKKSARGSGGAQVRPWYGETATRDKHIYFQKRVEGIPSSAVFVAFGGQAALVGATRQLIGTLWSGAASFAYVGSVGPLALHPMVYKAWCEIGDALANEFQLSGLFNVDAILQATRLWPLEVNPRYSASVEVLERALQIDAVALHVKACRDEECQPPLPSRSHRVGGKAVVYAPTDITIDERFELFVQQQNQASDWPAIADIPHMGTVIRAGRPLCTVFSDGTDLESVQGELQKNATIVQRMFELDAS